MNLKASLLIKGKKMGIPQFFGWLSRKYDRRIVSSDIGKVDHFFFDFNCLIYHCYAGLMRESYDKLKDKSLAKRQEALIIECLKYTKKIIEIVKPKESVDICVDGVVPMAKMHQQRLRRYKSPILKSWENDIKKRYGVYKEELLDTNQITPGTSFMRKLGEEFRNAISAKYFGKIVVSLSDADEFGEGEHKVLSRIRERKYKNKRICIYGLDADLIMLSLLVNNNDVILLRENVHIGDRSDSEFITVDINGLSELIENEMKNALREKANVRSPLEKNRLINDYVFLGFLLGNDFLHTLPSLSIANNGVDFVINLYALCYGKCRNYLLTTINSRTRINNGFLRNMFENLTKSEISNLRFLHQRKRIPNPPPFEDDYSEEKWKWDRIPYNSRFEKGFSVIDYKNPNWKVQYYRLFFNFEYEKSDDKVCLEDVCKNYFAGMLFTVRYYFDGDVSWYWYNPYPVSPFASDLYNYLNKLNDINLIQLPNGTPFSAIEQLMMVLPKYSSNLLPENLRREMETRLSLYYPDEFDWIYEERMMLYSIEPKLPRLDIEKIRGVIRECI